MLKFVLGTLTGVVLVFGSLYGTFRYMQSPRAQLNRCMSMYLDNSEELRKNQSIQDVMKERGFTNLEDLVKDRCQLWINNGQKF